MIISASRRTDIPAYFSEWFLNRIEAQYAYVRNPMNIRQVSSISLSPELVDCIVFWRYDPVLLNDRYTISWHAEQFDYIARKLCRHTDKVTISFIDLYRNITGAAKKENLHELSSVQKEAIAEAFAATAHACGLKIDTCAEDIDLSRWQIAHAHCIDGELISRLLGCPVDAVKDKNQRLGCGCMTGIDLGLYNTCQNGCIYCYANHNPAARLRNLQAYDPASPLLCSQLTEADKVTERKVKSLQYSFFDSIRIQ